MRKAGDVIPEVVKSVLADRPKGLRAWKFPTKCPVCGGPLVRLEGESDTFCTNVDCPGQRWARICHFTSRGAMDIEGFGERTVSQFLEHNLIHDPGDIYTLDWDGVRALEGFGEISVTNLQRAIEASKQRPLANLLVGLGIRHAGGTVSRVLAQAFGHLDALDGCVRRGDRGRRGHRRIIARSRPRVLRQRTQPRGDREAADRRVELRGPGTIDAPADAGGPVDRRHRHRSRGSRATPSRRRSRRTAARRREACRRRPPRSSPAKRPVRPSSRRRKSSTSPSSTRSSSSSSWRPASCLDVNVGSTSERHGRGRLPRRRRCGRCRPGRSSVRPGTAR